jgi:hypothetical protein
VTSINQKVEYVKGEARRDPGGHHCHWPGCDRKVAPALWGCKEHWYKLPRWLRSKIWQTYRPGQEKTKTPSREYVEVALEVQRWIESRPQPPQQGTLL